MREIKPSVLSTIMNYLYEQEHGIENELASDVHCRCPTRKNPIAAPEEQDRRNERIFKRVLAGENLC